MYELDGHGCWSNSPQNYKWFYSAFMKCSFLRFDSSPFMVQNHYFENNAWSQHDCRPTNNYIVTNLHSTIPVDAICRQPLLHLWFDVVSGWCGGAFPTCIVVWCIIYMMTLGSFRAGSKPLLHLWFDACLRLVLWCLPHKYCDMRHCLLWWHWVPSGLVANHSCLCVLIVVVRVGAVVPSTHVLWYEALSIMMTLGSFMAGSKRLLHLWFGVVRGWCSVVPSTGVLRYEANNYDDTGVLHGW